MKVGDRFQSLFQLEEAIKTFEKQTHTNLSRSNSRTIEAAKAKGIKRYFDPRLEYSEIDYVCIKFGKYISKSKGARPKQSSYREECPVRIRVRVTDDGSEFIIKEFEDKHNHTNSEVMYNHLPRQRRLDSDAKEIAKKLVTLRVNKKLLQNDIMRTQGKIVTLKDIHNLNLTCKNGNEIEEIARKYLAKGDTTIEFVKNEEGILKAIFYQDSEMKRLFQLCPEILFVDAIHKINDRRMPVYVFLIEDSNGQSEIVGFCLLTSEDINNVNFMAEIFKKHNPNWTKIRAIMSDKDFNERETFKAQFPQASLLICIFHCMRSFSRELSIEKMKITKGEKDLCLTILQKMVYAKSEEHYEELFRELKETKLSSVVNYIETNWHPIKNEWVVCFQSKSLTLGNRTNNRLESINQKITQVVSRFSRLDHLFDGLDNLLVTLRTERDHVAAAVFSKTRASASSMTEIEVQFNELLTPYAFNLVSKEMKLKDRVNVVAEDMENLTATVLSYSGQLRVSITECECSFWSSYQLPCHHIFKVLDLFGKPAFADQLCAERWTRKYYSKVCRLFLPTENDQQPLAPDKTHLHNEEVGLNVAQTLKPPKVLSYRERYRQAKVITDELATIMAEVTGTKFKYRNEEVLDLKKKWLDETEGQSCSLSLTETGSEAINAGNEMGTDKTPNQTFENEIETGNMTNETMGFDMETDNAANETNSTMRNYMEMDLITNENIDNGEQGVIFDRAITPITEDVDENENVSNTLEHNPKRILLNSQNLNQLPKLPPKIPKRGRPKGHSLTAIGIPKKKAKSLTTIQPFEKLSSLEKDQLVLTWLVSEDLAKKALNGHFIDSSEITNNPNDLSCAFLDENVTVFRLRKYFTKDAFASVINTVERKKKNPVWLCSICQADAKIESICCNRCLCWSHFKCAKVKSSYKKKTWFCCICSQK